MNLNPLGSRFRRPVSGLMRSHLAPCRPLRSLRLVQATVVRNWTGAAPAALPQDALTPLEPRRV